MSCNRDNYMKLEKAFDKFEYGMNMAFDNINPTLDRFGNNIMGKFDFMMDLLKKCST